MYLTRNQDFDRLANTFGIHLEGVRDYFDEEMRHDYTMAMDHAMAMDAAAQPTLITTPSAGIPSWMSMYTDPKWIEVLVAPNKAAKIFGEVKKGDWVTLTATFPMVEHTGETSAYGDWNQNGSTGANPNFPQRQSFHYQTMTQWGERQLEMAGLAKLDWVSRLNIASTMVLDKAQNNSYFFGVAGLQNYGLLNDPLLGASLTQGTKAANSPHWTGSGVVTATANEIYTDIQTLFIDLVAASNSLIEADDELVLAMDAQTSVALTATNSFNVNVYDLLKKNFPNIRFETAPQYNTAAGHMAQLICPTVEGQETGYCAFTEKMRAHAIVKHTSSFEQKKSQGTWGAVIFQPFAIQAMIGL